MSAQKRKVDIKDFFSNFRLDANPRILIIPLADCATRFYTGSFSERMFMA